METNTAPKKEMTEEFSADTVCATQIFERLSPEDRQKILEILRELNET